MTPANLIGLVQEKNIIISRLSDSGVKNHLSWSPGQVKFQAGQAHIFTHCPADK